MQIVIMSTYQPRHMNDHKGTSENITARYSVPLDQINPVKLINLKEFKISEQRVRDLTLLCWNQLFLFITRVVEFGGYLWKLSTKDNQNY